MANIKICGLTREEDINAVNEALPEFIGFVFAKSRRQVTPALARALRERLSPGIMPVGVFVNAPEADILKLYREGIIGAAQLHASLLKSRLDSRIKAVGVFVNEGIDTVAQCCKAGIIDLIQLHGDEDSAYIHELKKEISNSVIKAVRVRAAEDIVNAQMTDCDYLLLDTFSDTQYGGTGQSFDWKLIRDVNKPFFLAGGIGIENVSEAIRLANPYCIDVSSSVETGWVKDRQKIIDFIREARRMR